MKTLKQTYKLLLAAFIVVSLINTGFAQERRESFEKTFNLNSTGDFSFSCYETDLKVNTWDKNQVKLQGEIIIGGAKEEDQEKLLEVFKNPEVSSTSNSLSIETDLAKNTIIIGPFKKVTLVNGKTIRVDKFEAKYTLWIPAEVHFDLKSKYNDIDIASFNGNVDFDLYEVDLTLLSFNEGEFDMKYSQAEIGTGKSAKFDVYECEFEIKELDKLMVNTKYSDYNINKLGILAIGSYEDDFEIGVLSKGLTGQAKYSDFNIASNVTQIKMDVYESDIEALNVDKIEYTGKYSTLKAKDVNQLICKSLYEIKIYAGSVGDFACSESKYDNINFQEITKSIHLPSTYELKLDIQAVGANFESFYGDFKYGFVNLPLDNNFDFKLKFETKYGDVDFPKNRLLITDMNFEDSKKFFIGQTKEGAHCSIEFTAYDADIDLD